MALKEASVNGFDLRGGVGQQFSRFLKNDGEKKDTYNALESRAAKAEFRKQWARRGAIRGRCSECIRCVHPLGE